MVSPTPAPEPEKQLEPPVLSVSLPIEPDAFSEAILASIQAEATNWNAVVNVERDNQQDQSINRFLIDGTDAVLFVPGRPSGWNAILGKASRGKVPVFLLGEDVDIENPDYIACRLVPGATEVRATLGNPLAKMAEGKGILELTSPGTAMPLWRGDLGITTLARQNAVTRKQAHQTAAALANLFEGEVGLLIAYEDPIAIGAAEAFAYRDDGKPIPVVSLAGGKLALEALREGTLSAVAGPSPDTGTQLFEVIDDARRGKPLKPVLPLKLVLQTP